MYLSAQLPLWKSTWDMQVLYPWAAWQEYYLLASAGPSSHESKTPSPVIQLLPSNSARFGYTMKEKPPSPLRIGPQESYESALSNACDLS